VNEQIFTRPGSWRPVRVLSHIGSNRLQAACNPQAIRTEAQTSRWRRKSWFEPAYKRLAWTSRTSQTELGTLGPTDQSAKYRQLYAPQQLKAGTDLELETYSQQLKSERHPSGRTVSTSSKTPRPLLRGSSLPQKRQMHLAKRQRTYITEAQKRVLVDVANSNLFPSAKLREALGRELNISPRSVQIWFQNRGQSERKRNAKGQGMPTQMEGNTGTPLPLLTSPLAGPRDHDPPLEQQDCSSNLRQTLKPLSLGEIDQRYTSASQRTEGWEILRNTNGARSE